MFLFGTTAVFLQRELVTVSLSTCYHDPKNYFRTGDQEAIRRHITAALEQHEQERSRLERELNDLKHEREELKRRTTQLDLALKEERTKFAAAQVTMAPNNNNDNDANNDLATALTLRNGEYERLATELKRAWNAHRRELERLERRRNHPQVAAGARAMLLAELDYATQLHGQECVKIERALDNLPLFSAR